MTNERKKGGTGLSVPVIQPTNPPRKKKTVQEVAKWCAALPMADTGAAAKKLFIALDEITNTEMTAKERYSILELLRNPNKIICTALKRHYIEQRSPLTERKIMIANLRQTLLTLMADNYKLIMEELHAKSSLDAEEKKLLATSIVRILYYLNVLLICRYQLYSYTPPNLWHEIHLLYKYAKNNKILELRVPCQFATNKETSILEAYTRIIMLYATDPYQWRQREQHSLNKAIEMWALYPVIHEYNQIPNQRAGVYIIDINLDEPPNSYIFRKIPLTETCIALDLSKAVEHLQKILDKLKHNHLQAKLENPNDPEFLVTAPTIAKLIKVWTQHIPRVSERFPIQGQIKIVFGLTAAHYYVNDEKEFNPRPNNLQTDLTDTGKKAIASLPLYEVSEEEEAEEEPEKLSSTEIEAAKTPTEETDSLNDGEEQISKDQLYHIYNYNIENISPQGFCIVIRDKSYPPFQAGEVVAFKNLTNHDTEWGIGALRWLRRQQNEEFHMGIQILGPYARAGGVQLMRGDKPANRLLKCLVLPPSEENKPAPLLITTSAPIHSNTVLLYIDDEPPIKASITKEVDASGMYYLFEYQTEAGVDVINKPKDSDKPSQGSSGSDEEKTNTEFDSIWGDL